MVDKRILIIDDDHEVLNTLAEILLTGGYEVMRAETFAEALEIAENNLPPVTLIDLRLPDGSGADLHLRFQQLNPEIINIIITAYNDIDSAVSTLTSGAFQYMHKPIMADELLHVVRHAFEALALREAKQAADEELTRERASLEAIFDNSHDGIFLFDKRGKVLSANKVVMEFTGLPEQDIIGKPIFKLLGADEETRTRRLWREILTGNKRHDKIWMRMRGGDKYQLGYRAIPNILPNQNLLILQDLTSLIKSEIALEESERKYTQLFNEMAEGVFYQSGDGKFIDVNAAALDMFGLMRKEFIGKDSFDPFWKVIDQDSKTLPPENRPSLIALKTGKEVNDCVLAVFNAKRNEYVWLQVTAKPQFRDGEKSPYQVFVTLHDITQLKKAEQDIRNKEAKLTEIQRQLSLFMEASEEQFVYYSPDLKIQWANEAFSSFYDMEPDDIFGRHCYELLHNHDEPCDDCPLLEVLSTGKPSSSEVLTPNGRYLLMRGYPIKDNEGEIIALAEFTHDISEQKQNQANLINERDKAQKYLDVAGVMFIAINREGNVTLANKQACRILECKEDEIVGKDWFDNFIPSEISESVRNVFDLIVTGEIEQTEYYENEVLTKTGRKKTIAWHNTILWDEQKKITHTLSSGEDITEKNQVLQALKESEEKYRLFFENNQVGVYRTTPQGKIIECNLAFARMLGYDSIEEVRSLNAKSLYYNDSERIAFIDALESEDALRDNEFILKKKNGDPIWIIESVIILRDDDGNPYELQGTMIDISEMKMAVSEIEAIFEMSLDMICIADINTATFTKINPSFSRILGYTEEELLGRPFLDFIHPDDVQKTVDVIEQELKKGSKVLSFENRYRRKDGEYLTFEWNSHPAPELGITYAIAHDITERKKMEEELIASEVRFHSIYDDSPVPLWEEDFSEVKKRFDELKQSGVTDFRKYYDDNPGEVAVLAGVVEIVYINQASVKFFQVESIEEIQVNLPQHFNERSLVVFKEELIALAEGKTEFESEIPIDYLHRGERLLYIRLKVITGYEDDLSRVLMSFVDITEEKRAAEALRESEERYRRIVDNINDALLIHDFNGMIIGVNQNTCDLYGYDMRELIGAHMSKISIVSDEQLKENIETVINKGKLITEGVNIHKDGKEVHVSISSKLVIVQGGGIIQAFIRDISDLKQTEIALRESEERFKQLFDKMQDGVAIYEAVDNGNDFIFKDINTAGQKISEIKRDDVIGKRLSEMFPGAAEMGLVDALRRCWQTGEPEEIPLIRYKEDKIREWVENYIYILPSGEMVAVYQDTSEQKKAEAALRESQRELAALMGNIPGMAYRCLNNEKYTMTFVSEGCRELTGYVQRDLMHDKKVTFSDIIHPEDRDMVRAKVVNAIDKQQNYQMEYRIITADNEVKWVWEKGAGVHFKSGDVDYLEGLIIDVTARIKAFDALSESEQRFRLLFENQGEGVTMVDIEENITIANPAADEIFGVEPGRLEGRSIRNFVSPEHWELLKEQTKRRIEGRRDSYELNILRDNGEVRNIIVTSNPWWDRTGTVVGALSIFRDITETRNAENERIKLESRIQQAQKMESLSLLAGGVAHDYNNLLQGILGNAGLALMDLPDDSSVIESIEAIKRSAQHAAELTKQMLAFSGRGSFAVRSFNLSSLVEQMNQLISANISKKITVKFNLSEEKTIAKADVTQVRQVLMNLVTNAAEAIGDKEGRIIISTALRDYTHESMEKVFSKVELIPGRYICLQVEDNGCGIKNSQISQVLDPFFSTKFTGRGLGLAAVYGIVSEHGGGILIESEEGKWTIFSIIFPEYHIEEKEVKHRPDDKNDFRFSGTVLLADDENAVLDVSAKILSKLGFSVLKAANGGEALELFMENKDKIDVVILDLTMPVMSGIEVMEEIYRISEEIPVLLSSGYNEDDTVKKQYRIKPSAFLQKPYEFKRIKQALKDVLTKRKK